VRSFMLRLEPGPAQSAAPPELVGVCWSGWLTDLAVAAAYPRSCTAQMSALLKRPNAGVAG